MVSYTPVRDKETVKAEYERVREQYKENGGSDGPNHWKYVQQLRDLATEYHTEVLEEFESEHKAVRLWKHGTRFHVSVYELVGNSSRSGALFFGGTEDEDAARTAYHKEISDVSQE